jgi:intermembrane space import and assembly protein 40
MGQLLWLSLTGVVWSAAQTIPPPSQFSDADVPTVEAVIEQKRRETRASPAVAPSAHAATPTPEATSEQTTSATPSEAQPGFQEGSPEALEEEAGQQGAFNPETGEINWDCPCLGGMADGPCGEDFKAAFSCFVFSESEPKGMDCIDKFQHMQDCFRKYPEIYGAELQDDEEDDSPAPVAGAEGAGPGDVQPESPKETGVEIAQKAERQHAVETPSKTEETVQEPRKADVKKDEHPGVPTAAVDATAANEGETTEVPGKQ